MGALSEPQLWIGFFTLLILEIVLGIDNVIFISILSGKLPASERKKAWQVGLGLALVIRILLLLSISWIIGLKAELFQLPFMDKGTTGKDLILFFGGLFLIYKSVKEIHEKLEGDPHVQDVKVVSFWTVIIQILLVDLVFSLDSVITAVGMVSNVGIMIAAVIVSMTIMLFSAQAISDFVNKHPTVKMLALSFLVMIGTLLVAEGMHHKVPKEYIYFAMAFSVGVEILNLRLKSKRVPVELHAAGELEVPKG